MPLIAHKEVFLPKAEQDQQGLAQSNGLLPKRQRRLQSMRRVTADRIEALAKIDDGRLTVCNATILLDLMRRQVFPTSEANSSERAVKNHTFICPILE